MKKIVFIAIFSILIIGPFAANAIKTFNKTEKVNVEAVKKVYLSGAILNTGNLTAHFVIEDRTYSSPCGTWTVSGTPQSPTTPEQEQSFCNQACANGWTYWEWDGTNLTGHA